MKDKIVIREIADGIRFVGCKTDRFKTTRISIKFAVPISDDVSAFAMLPGLIKYTSKAFPDNAETEKKLASLYGASFSVGLDKIGDFQVISYTVNCIADRFALHGENIANDCAAFLRDTVFEPDFDAAGMFKTDNIIREKRLLKEAIEADENDKMSLAMLNFEKEMYRGEKGAANAKGNKRQVDEASTQQISGAWKYMIEKGRVQLSVIGENGGEDEVGIFKKAFENFGRSFEGICTKAHTPKEKMNEKTDEAVLNQSKLVIGWSVGSDNFYALRVMNCIFGSGVNSKLFKIVREKMSLCYYCSSRYNRLKKVLYVQSGIKCEDKEKTTAAIFEQLEAVKSGDFSDGELGLAKIALDDAYRSSSDTTREIDLWYSSQILDSNCKSAEEYRRKVAEVTRKDVIEAARTLKADTVYTLLGKAAQ